MPPYLSVLIPPAGWPSATSRVIRALEGDPHDRNPALAREMRRVWGGEETS